MEEDKQEALRIVEEIHVTIKELEESEFYSKALNLLNNDQSIKTQISRVVGPNSQLKMVIYGLGSIEYSFYSQFQLSLAILLRRDFNHWIDEIEIYDPKTTTTDSIAMEMLGCRVLSENEECMRQVEEPTLFFTPFLDCKLLGNIFKANWCPARLNRMILLGNSLGRIAEYHNRGSYVEGEMWRIANIERYMEEFAIDPCGYHKLFIQRPFQMLGWHFFNLSPDVDMDALLPKDEREEYTPPEKDEDEEYYKPENYGKIIEKSTAEPFITKDWKYIFMEKRRPRRFRQKWWAPHPGWIKLNFAGTNPDNGGPSDFGGIFHNDHGDILFSYGGPLDDCDQITAGIEALRVGIRCLEVISTVHRLIVEGDALSIIRWANVTIGPPEKFKPAFDEINDLTVDVECVFVHVYREANSTAEELAYRGANLTELCVLESSL